MTTLNLIKVKLNEIISKSFIDVQFVLFRRIYLYRSKLIYIRSTNSTELHWVNSANFQEAVVTVTIVTFTYMGNWLFLMCNIFYRQCLFVCFNSLCFVDWFNNLKNYIYRTSLVLLSGYEGSYSVVEQFLYITN